MDCPTCGAKDLDPEQSRFCNACGMTLTPSVDRMLGQVVGGRFRVASLIAEGGMGRVYVAEQMMGTTMRKVAIKTLLSEFANSESQVQRFLAECSVVAELEHPNTIKFYDWGKTDAGDLFIAMEFVSGESLADVVRREKHLTPERADVIVGQICGSLQEAHDKGIVHRDVKPENVLLTSPAGENDFVKVLDFGIAKREGNFPKLTPHGLVLGSPAYMSPEQFSPGPVDGRSDVYSLGVVAFEALTGFQPFQAKELLEWPTLHRTAPPMAWAQTGVQLPETMKRAVERALSKRPGDRPGSMREFFAEFTLGTPRRSSLSSAAPPITPAADDAVTLMHLSAHPSALPSASGRTQSGPGVPSDPRSYEESSVMQGDVVVPKAPRVPPGLVPPTEPMLPIASDPLTSAPLPSSMPSAVASSGAPSPQRDALPPTMRDMEVPRAKRPLWPFLLLAAMVVLGGAAAVVVFVVLPRFHTQAQPAPRKPPVKAPPKRH